METGISPFWSRQLQLAHPSWQPHLKSGLDAVYAASPRYLANLERAHFLPTQDRIFAAFAQTMDDVRYVLIGEGPYPREESATGICFMDGAVDALWSEDGLAKKLNRATSLRNFMKMLLVAEGLLDDALTTKEAVAKARDLGMQQQPPLIQRLTQLQENLFRQGFLLLNASLVFRADVPPVQDAKAWLPFLRVVLSALAEKNVNRNNEVKLVLWGKIAEQVHAMQESRLFGLIVAEHPYNLSFVTNKAMQEFFKPMRLLRTC